MRRTDLMDTKPEVHREILRRLREMTTEERLRVTMDQIDLGWKIHDAALARLGMSRNQWNQTRR